jgi:hypothetical protein
MIIDPFYRQRRRKNWTGLGLGTPTPRSERTGQGAVFESSADDTRFHLHQSSSVTMLHPVLAVGKPRDTASFRPLPGDGGPGTHSNFCEDKDKSGKDPDDTWAYTPDQKHFLKSVADKGQ